MGFRNKLLMIAKLKNTNRNRIFNLRGVQNFGLDQVFLIYRVLVLTRNILLFDNFVAL